jgi:hypothetical protein
MESVERFVELLSEQQHLAPHQTVEHAIGAAGDRVGLCSGAGRRGLEVLGIHESTKVGRLRRSELIQLGRTIHRIWRQNAAAAVGESQPA